MIDCGEMPRNAAYIGTKGDVHRNGVRCEVMAVRQMLQSDRRRATATYSSKHAAISML